MADRNIRLRVTTVKEFDLNTKSAAVGAFVAEAIEQNEGYTEVGWSMEEAAVGGVASKTKVEFLDEDGKVK